MIKLDGGASLHAFSYVISFFYFIHNSVHFLYERVVEMDFKKLQHYDIVVVGAGTAGIPAAIAAARSGCKTLLVEKRAALGGMMTSGMPALGFLDRQLNHVVGGIPQEMADELQEMGAGFGNLRCPIHNSITTSSPWWYRILAAKKCTDAGVDVLMNTDLLDVRVINGKVTGATLLSGTYTYDVDCSVLIDATGDAAAAYMAGANYDMGQPEDLESTIQKEAAKETRYDIGHSRAGKVQPVSITFCLGNVNTEKFMAYIKEHPETYKSPEGYGMHYDQDYLFNSPAVYFTGFGEFIEEAKKNGDFDILRDRVIFATQPNKGEYMINATRVIDVDPTDPVEMSKAELECYRQVGMLTQFFKKYCPGFEDCFLANIGMYTGVRESRRINGLRTVTQSDIEKLLIPEDCIALGGYNCDIHLSGVGLYFQPVDHAVGVPYGAMVSNNIDGLLVTGRCISVDSYALAVLRVMGACLALGEAAGTAAAIAVKDNVRIADVDVKKLQRTLVDNGAIISIPK